MTDSRDTDFAVLLATQNRALIKYARNLSSNSADADDLLQDTLLRCWSAQHTFQRGTSIGAWTRTVMKNSFISGTRKQRSSVDVADEILDGLLSVPPSQETAVMLKDAHWALNELIPEHRHAVLLAAEGFSMEEAAGKLGISAGAFKSRLMRGRMRLRILDDDNPSI